MSAAKHTPGPWEWQTSNSWRRLGSVRGDGDVMSPCVQRDGHPDVTFKNGGVDGPDARLIAAAPAMVKALETAYLALLQHPLDLWRIQNQPLLCTLRDTLAECTGQSGEDVQNEYEARAAIKAAKGEA